MKDQRNIIGPAGSAASGVSWRGAHVVQRKLARRFGRINLEFDNWNPSRVGDLARRAIHASENQKGLGVEIREIEIKLAGPVARIEGRGGRVASDRQEGARHLRTIGKNDCNSIALPNAQRTD